MKRFSSYKDSGIEWIGQVPQDWQVNRLKTVSTLTYGDSLANEGRIEGDIPVYGSNGIIGYNNRAITHKPCIIIGRKGSCGKVNFSQTECFPIDTTYFVDDRSAKCDLKWLNYVLSLLELDRLSKDTGVPGLNREDAYDKRVPVPESSVQKAIATYLDRKIGQIDDLIAKKERMIEFLKEERTAIINQAVTKGLPLSYMFDTNAFDRLLEEDAAQFHAKIFITHIQKDQIEAIPQDKIEKKKRLLDIIHIIDSDRIPTSVAVWGVSKWDECCFGTDKNNALYQKISKGNGAQDALIAVTAISRFLTLVTDDKNLLRDVKEADGRAITFDEFKQGDYTELNDSGIEWLGKVPNSWRVVPLTKYLEPVIDYRGKTPMKNQYGGVFLVTAKNIKDGAIDYSLSQEYVDPNEYAEIMSRGLPQKGDVLFTTEAPLGEVANIDREEVALAQRVIKFRGKKGILDNYFLKYWLMSNVFQNHLQSLATGSTALGIKASKLNLLKLVLPDLREQKEIVIYVNNKLNEMQEMVQEIDGTINLLKEYHISLISEVVTGKIDTRREVNA